MTQLNKQHQVKTKLPAQRAQGLEPEITAQPRPIPDELALEASAEPDLSVDADELGSRFLRDAIEQGDFDPERAWPEESSLIETPARDGAIASTNFVAGNPIWEQTVDLETRTQGAADLLREPPPPAAADFDAALRETMPDPIDVQDNSAHILDTSVREFSLFDGSDEDEEQSAPRNARPARDEEDVQDRRSRGARPQATSGPQRLLRAALTRGAHALRSLADKLQQRAS